MGSTAPTRVLDWSSAPVASLTARVDALGSSSDVAWLRDAHAQVSALIGPVYALDDTQPVSTTIRRRRGSCGQRLATLEALARRHGVRTRVQGIVVDGRFWHPRFEKLSWLVPERVVLAWPEFSCEGSWLPVGELFEPDSDPTTFTNAGAETLFDAVGRTHVRWSGDCSDGVCDLTGHVLENLGYFDHRDSLFDTVGQTLCWTARSVGEPFLSRRSAGAGR